MAFPSLKLLELLPKFVAIALPVTATLAAAAISESLMVRLMVAGSWALADGSAIAAARIASDQYVDALIMVRPPFSLTANAQIGDAHENRLDA